MHHPTERIAYTTAFVTPVVEHWLERKITSTGCVTAGEIVLYLVSLMKEVIARIALVV